MQNSISHVTWGISYMVDSYVKLENPDVELENPNVEFQNPTYNIGRRKTEITSDFFGPLKIVE